MMFLTAICSRLGQSVTSSKARKLAMLACLAVLGSLLVSGCKEKVEEPPVPTPAEIKPVDPKDSQEVQDATRVAQLKAFHAGIEPPPAELKLKGGERATPEVLAAYNQELNRVRLQMGESPESLQEIVQKWIKGRKLLPALPTPPPGKKIVYDPLRIIIRLDPPD